MQSNLAIPDSTRVCLFPKWVFYIEVFDNISPRLREVASAAKARDHATSDQRF